MANVKRQSVTDMSITQETAASSRALDRLASYFSRQTDKSTVQAAMEVYSMGIGQADAGDDSTVETIIAKGFTEEIYSGAIDAMTMGWGHKVIDAKATLFSEPGSKFSLTHETVEDVKDVENLIFSHRKRGGFKPAVVRCDKGSVAIGSCSMLVSYHDGSLQYKKFDPGQVRVKFGESITEVDEDGETTTRPVNQSDIEDASLVMIRLGASSIDEFAWLAIIPRTDSELYPYGRYVYFTAKADEVEVPDAVHADKQRDEGVYDFRLDGKIINPLSWYAEEHPELDVPEIPLAIMYGGTTDEDVLFPTCNTIYNMSVSFDKKTSHISDKADDKAAGTLVLSETNEAQGKPLPRSMRGNVRLQAGQMIDEKGTDASACQQAHEILRDDKVEAAASFSVPDFFISPEDYTVEASSGVALAIKAKPLRQDREFRSELNTDFVDRLFKIEKSYIGFKEEGDPGLIEILLGCEQTWEPGSLVLPENKKEAAERVSMLFDKGHIDTIQLIKEIYQLPSDQEAIEFYDKMEERKNEYPPVSLVEPPPAPVKPVGINRQRKNLR